MTEAQGFDVRIIYVCIINSTDSREILGDFIQLGGWNSLSKWLEIFIQSNKHAAIREILKAFQKLPVTPKTLSVPVETKDLPGKMIRSLRKHQDDDIKKIASEIYKAWIKMVDEQKAEKEKERKKRKLNNENDVKPGEEKVKEKSKKPKQQGPVRKYHLTLILTAKYLSTRHQFEKRFS